ncbi:MAG: chain length determinant protein EpsF [Pseudomonadota bacterium]
MTFQHFLSILLARYRIVLYALLATVATTLVVSLLLPKQYAASADVVVDVKSPDPIAGMVLPAMAMPGYMATQVDIINSNRVAQKVVRLLKLDQNPKVIEDWREDTEGEGRIEAWLAKLLKKKLDVRPSRESNVISIEFKSTDPQFSAAIANAFAQAYIDTSIELKVEPARQYNQYFEAQVRQRREVLEAAQARLSEFQRNKGIVLTDDRLNYENQKLNELQTQLVIAEGQSAEARSKQRTGGDTLQDVMQNPLINELKAAVARAEAKLQETAGNLGRNHPQYQSQQAELASLQRKLAAETRQVASAIGTSSRVSKGKEGEIRASIDAHKKRILQLKEGRDEASVLQREVDTAQRAYDLVSQRLTQTDLESKNMQTNVSILTPADAPVEHSSPRLLLNLVLAVFLGTLLGVGAALLAELIDRRVRSAADLAESLGLQVLATIDGRLPKPRRFKPVWSGAAR